MTFHSIAGSAKVRNAVALLAAVAVIFAVMLAGRYGLISAGYDWLTQSLIEMPHRVLTNLTSLPERLNPTSIESN